MKLESLLLAAAAASSTSASLSPLRRHDTRANSHHRNPAPITSTLDAFWFDVEVQIDGQSFFLLVDTGSSDTWVAKTGYRCISSLNHTELPQGDCGWSPTFDEPDGFEYIQNQTFGVKYGTGIAIGKVAVANVTLAGVTVAGQTVGIVDSTNDKADGLNSGILGLGYPALTSAHYGLNNSNSTEALLTNRAVYDPLFANMYKKDLVDSSWYSIALERPQKNLTTSPGGWLGLGELPPVSHSNDWAVAGVEITEAIPVEFYPQGKPEITLMTLSVDSVTWGKSKAPKASLKTNSTKFQAVVDTGNPLNELPTEVAAEINTAFDPPAQFSEDLGVYVVDCNATAPQVGVTIDKHTFWHEAVDLIREDASTGLCYSAITPAAEDLGISLSFLGDAFLRNVVSVFDMGKDEMRFAARTEETADQPTPTSITSGASVLGRHGIWQLGVALGLLSQLM
ncbi:aspartic peptidase domain-containing protein [Thelonectria olida]|uniref:Aspartic peptidase domain-containing protein n=1 Tax=Thelonectria olida TaxID=1576542 RepID=A0A9P9AZ92_9HYPO|nr:aspartic peptidase domain-containing protein [Thelonectria olida]